MSTISENENFQLVQNTDEENKFDRRNKDKNVIAIYGTKNEIQTEQQ